METEHNVYSEETGGKKEKKAKKDIIIVGKIYADWCGHCQMLGPEWKKMKKLIHKKKGKQHLVFAEIEEKDIDSKLRTLEEKHRVSISANGYPTLFRIKNGKVVYYDGERNADKMTEWYLRGGEGVEGGGGEENENMPGLMKDQQGGKRTHRYKKPHTNRIIAQHTRKRRQTKGGLLGFLFGK